MKFTQPRNGNYYDLVRIPHGHIPAPRVKFWSWLPIPIKGQRTYNTFHCPICGSPSFFKVRGHCEDCGPIYDDDEQQWKNWAKKEDVRNRWKRLEEILLPLLVLLGKAWYMPSDRLNYLEQVKKYGPGLNVEPWMEDDEGLDLLLDEPTGENCSICGKPLTQRDEIATPDHPQCCEEHGDYLDLCENCWDTWMMRCQEPEGCIRKWFENRRIKIEASDSS